MDGSLRWPGTTLRIVVFVLFLWVTRDLLVPAVLGAIFALLLHPWHRWLTRRLGRARRMSPLILTLGAIMLGVIPVIVVTLEALSSANEILSGDLVDQLERIQKQISTKLIPWARGFDIEASRVREGLRDLIPRLAAFVTGLLTRIARNLPGFLVDLFLFVIALFYLLRDGAMLSAWLLDVLPFKHRETRHLFTSIRNAVHGAILGTIATAFVQGALTTLALLVFRVPGAFLLGFIAVLMSFIPLIGTTPVTVGAVIYFLVDERWFSAAGMALAALVVGTSDNVVRPWVQSLHGRMHPLLVILAIFGGLQVFGPFGIFIGPVVAAMALWTLEPHRSPERAEPPA